VYREKVVAKGRPSLITNDPAACIPSADIILLIAPAFAFKPILHSIAAHLKPKALVVSLPGLGGFQWLARDAFASKKDVIIAGTNQLPFQCRIQQFGRRVELLGYKEQVKCATFPAESELNKNVCQVLSQLIKGCTVLPIEEDVFAAITLTPANQVIHPSIMYGLFGDFEEGKEYEEQMLFYKNTDEKTAKIMDDVSAEIGLVATALSKGTVMF
jgi:hypothetical protein